MNINLCLDIEYSITVKTGDFRNSGTNGPVYIQIFGRDNKQTDDILYRLRFLFQNNDIEFLEKEEIELKVKLSCVYQKLIDFYESKHKEECNEEFILKKYEYMDKLLKL